MLYVRPASSLILLALIVLHIRCTNPDTSMATDYEPANVGLTWAVVTNLDAPGVFTSSLRIVNEDHTPLSNEGWALYFNFIRLIDSSTLPDIVRLTHINGDFYRLEPTADFPTLTTGESVDIAFESSAWAIKKSDAPAGFYMVYVDEDGRKSAPRPIVDYTVAPFESPAQTMRDANDIVPVPSPASRFAENALLHSVDEAALPPVLPTPDRWTRREGEMELTGAARIHYTAGLDWEAEYLSAALFDVLPAMLPVSESAESGPGIIRLSVDSNVAASDISGAYHLEISRNDGVHIVGADPAGVFYGIQTLRGLIPPEAYHDPVDGIALPAFDIQDKPRFSYRGLHMDVARNFHPKQEILKMLDVMAFYKLNKFHFHLTDDEGWRLAIDGLPELTEVGSRRGHTEDERDHLYPSLGSGPNPDESYGSGHYSRQDFVDILRYAGARHIEVIPEIDLPGHARAAIRAMEARHARLSANDVVDIEDYRLIHPEDASSYMSVQMWNDNVIDVCLPSSYAFIEHVVDDLIAMYEEAGSRLATLHAGNDEVPHGAWLGSPACAALKTAHYNEYFLDRLLDLLRERNLRLAGWEEIALKEQTAGGVTTKAPNLDFVNSNFIPYVWNSVWGWGSEGTAYSLANAGYDIVMANATNLYFDFAYDKDPEEPGFYWAGFNNTRKAFAFNPFDLYQNASTGLFGQPIDAETVYRSYPRLTAEGRRHILGIQGQLWSENAKGSEMLEYLLFPKLLGLAERAWSRPPDWFSSADPEERAADEDAGWNVFANKLGRHELPRLDAIYGVAYRIPPPGAVLVDGRAEANTAFPGLRIHYTTEDRAPRIDDPTYTDPVSFTGSVNFRAFASNGRSSRTVRLDADSLRE